MLARKGKINFDQKILFFLKTTVLSLDEVTVTWFIDARRLSCMIVFGVLKKTLNKLEAKRKR